jgi:hypothetical protein
MSFFTKIENSRQNSYRRIKTPNNKNNPKQKDQYWRYHNTRLQILLLSHTNKNSMVPAQN